MNENLHLGQPTVFPKTAIFNLEQLKQKKQPREKPKFVVNVFTKPPIKKKEQEEEENEELNDFSERIVEGDPFAVAREGKNKVQKKTNIQNEKEPNENTIEEDALKENDKITGVNLNRKKVAIIDKRQNAAINRELVLGRIRDKMDIFAVKKADKRVIETTPQTRVPIVEEPVILNTQDDLEKEEENNQKVAEEVDEKEEEEEKTQEEEGEKQAEEEEDEKTQEEEEEEKQAEEEEKQTKQNLEEAEKNVEKAKKNIEDAKENIGKIKEKIEVIKKNKKNEKNKENKAKIEEELLKVNEELKEANEILKNAKEENEEALKAFKVAKKENDDAIKKIKENAKKQKKTDETKKKEVNEEANKKRKTRKIYAAIDDFEGLDKNIKINKKFLKERLPKKEKVLIKTSSFYLNNRKKYIQRVNEMLKPYQTELKESANKDVSCDRGKNTDISLFLHQRIVREYLNVITPYRGLLLYHGLGSGKTCTSIGIAEGMKTSKPIILMTPASLKMNYFSQLKKCGDPMYKKNQFWEFVSTEGKPEYIPVFSQVLQIPKEIIEQKRGAWLVDVTKKQSNYETLSTADQKDLDNQLNLMIRSKYTDINYNGITKKKLAEITEDFTINPFDNKTIIIDEAHNFVSRIVNKLKSSKSTPYLLYDYLMKATNAKIVLLTGTPIINYPNEIGVLFNILRGYIKTWTFQLEISSDAPPGFKLNAEEIVKMFHRSKINVYDYVEFTNNKLVITRNPFGFVHIDKHKPTKQKATNVFGGEINEEPFKKYTLKKHLLKNPNKNFRKSMKHKKKDDLTGSSKRSVGKNDFNKSDVYNVENGMVNINKKLVNGMKKIEDTMTTEDDPRIHYQVGYDIHKGGGIPYIETTYDGIHLDETGNISDDEFINNVRGVLKKNHITIVEAGTKVELHKALPDNAETFINLFVNDINSTIKNENTFKKRILGLTSYFRSADEELLPSYVLSTEPTERDQIYHIVRSEMSSYQFAYYEKIRKKEAEQEKMAARNAAKRKGTQLNDMFNIASSYRMFSRAACNFAFPEPPGRPLPEREDELEEIDEEKNKKALATIFEEEFNEEVGEMEEPEEENEEEVNKQKNKVNAKNSYQRRVQEALEKLRFESTKPPEEQYLLRANLENYSSKFHKILLNIENPINRGNHLVYSQFRSIEGIEILKMVLEANGFAEFKLKRGSHENSWEINNYTNILGKPRFVLYTGTETSEEKEIIRNIYNSDWEFVPETVTSQLREISNNNHYGDIIKVFMITASGSEGIDLKNTRFVHIVEPYWNMVRIEQVIGRARRICSHQDLPEEMRTVQVYLYLSVFSEEQKTNKKNIEIMLRDVSRLNKKPITTDENLYDIAIVKTKINNEILKAVKETSMDCSVYNSSSQENLVCYNFGRVLTNAFSSHPSIEEDIQLGETDYMNVRKEKTKIILVPKKDPKYAMNKDTFELYSLESYNRAIAGTGVLELIGKVENKKIILF